MKLFVAILAAMSVLALTLPLVAATPPYMSMLPRTRLASHPLTHTIKWFDLQYIDHDVPSLGTWKQRYAVNDTYYKPGTGSPVFLFLCGEASMENYFMETLPLEMAKEHNALYILIEHRFYGESMPYPTLDTASLGVLSSQQAIADAARFIEQYKNHEVGADSKWMIFGASYSACLAAWFRTLHSDLVVGAVAPSGPVIAKEDMLSYYGQFGRDVSVECSSVVREAGETMAAMLGTDDGRQELSQIFNSCEPLAAEDAYFFVWLNVGELGSMTQGQLPPQWPLNATCSDLVASQSVTDALKVWAGVVGGGGGCVNYKEESYLKSLRNVTGVGNDGSRSWFYQKCREFGFFHDTAAGSSVFPPMISVEHNLEWCRKVFDAPGMAPHIDKTNSYYAGLWTDATNIMFTNGKLDPWHNLSINEDLPSGGVKAVTYTAGHCAPFHEPTSEDPWDLLQARKAVREFVASLL